MRVLLNEIMRCIIAKQQEFIFERVNVENKP